ncbi:hypothetical protein FKO01_20000 [Mesorhizobium sp. B2-3-3]|nr:hypothetical protein FKO01_20000 [Mesorhizobium sp. B2-3-3]
MTSLNLLMVMFCCAEYGDVRPCLLDARGAIPLTTKMSYRRPLIGASPMVWSTARLNDSDQCANKLNHIVCGEGCLIGTLPNVLGGGAT